MKKPIIVKSKKTGKEIRLLRPNEKAEKYAKELKRNAHYTNSGRIKLDENKNVQHLTQAQKAYRSGYLQARNDNTKVYKYKNKI